MRLIRRAAYRSASPQGKRSRADRGLPDGLWPRRELGRVYQARSPKSANESQNQSNRYHELSHLVSSGQAIGRGDAEARFAAGVGGVENDRERR
jgi:hypothetical protein